MDSVDILTMCVVILIGLLAFGVFFYLYDHRPAEPLAQYKLTEFLEVAKLFADRQDYNKTGYNCKNFSQDVAKIAANMRIPVKIVRGCANQSQDCHQWLQIIVDFEPQSATFVDYSEKYKYNRNEIK